MATEGKTAWPTQGQGNRPAARPGRHPLDHKGWGLDALSKAHWIRLMAWTERARRGRAGTAVLLVGALSLTLAACEYPGVPHPLAAQGEGTGSAGSPAPALAAPEKEPPAGQNPGGSNPGPLALQGTVEVALKDFKLDPDHLTVKAGAVTFVLKNEGRYTHDFRVEGQGIDDKAPKVGQGRTFEWGITLPPGSYRISCPISNHADRGMNGTLEVVP